MSYRNITVNGVKYKYVTGKSHTKVVDVGVARNEDIGSYHWRGISPCGVKCSCDQYEEVLILNIKPSDVANFIKSKLKYGKNLNLPLNTVPDGYKVGSVRKIVWECADE